MSRWMGVAVLGCVLACCSTAARAADEAKADEGWTVLFDGKDLAKWDYKEGGWSIDDEGAMAWKKGCGTIWSKEKYQDFVLDLDFKVAKGTNSGIFLRTKDRGNWLHTGIELQVLDSFGKKPDKHTCAAMYDCLAPTKEASKPAGEWNHITITANKSKLQVVLNGEQVIDADLSQWTEAHKNPDGSPNKFNYPYKDLVWSGYVGFQDHGGAVWCRNVKVKVLEETK